MRQSKPKLIAAPGTAKLRRRPNHSTKFETARIKPDGNPAQSNGILILAERSGDGELELGRIESSAERKRDRDRSHLRAAAPREIDGSPGESNPSPPGEERVGDEMGGNGGGLPRGGPPREPGLEATRERHVPLTGAAHPGGAGLQ